MVKLFTVFFVLVSFLHAHESADGHMHFLNTLHVQDIFAVVAALLIGLLIYRNFLMSR